MTIIVGGHGLGLQDTSLGLLGRNDQTNLATLGSGVESYLNVANGNLLIQERDAFLPSLGHDFALTRTYNSRGAIQGSADGWWWSTGVTLEKHQDTPAGSNGTVTNYLLTYGDGSTRHFDFDASRNLWVSTDGAGAYETLQDLNRNNGISFVVTRADQTKYNFDKNYTLLSIVDSNGVTTSFDYQGGRIQTIADDTGHQIVYQYAAGKLAAVIDRHAGQADTVLVRYAYSGSLLTQVTDRFGHTTTYTYNNHGLLIKVSLPAQQTVAGVLETYEAREIQFTYESINWSDNPHLLTPFDRGSQWILTSITDPIGGVTSFAYDFRFDTTAPAAGDRDLNYKVGGGRYFAGGTTRVTDAAGHSVSYTYDADGYITRVVDQLGLATVYTYGGKDSGDAQSAINQDNLLSVTDRNGAGATTSDSAYFRELRRDLGFVDAAGNGKLVSALTAAEITQILDKFTTRHTYDGHGNLLTRTDPLGNQESWTYTAFDKVATATSALGNALATSDDALVQAKRVELGYPASAAALTTAQRDALRALYTTSYDYDTKFNLITRTDPGGDVTRFEYDANGNLTRRTVEYRDAGNTAVAAKNQVTTYAYDGFGNNTSMADGEGAVTLKSYDHFGNLLSVTDGRANVTAYTYDADNRLLTATDAEGHRTINKYDAVGNRIAITDAAGKTVTQIFDRDNRLVATIDPSLADPASTRRTEFTYDILGNRTQVKDAEGRTTTYSYDAKRQLIDVRTPQVLKADGTLTGYTTSYAYDGESRIVTKTDNNGAVTQSLYTADGLLKRMTDPVGNVTEYLYDANRQQVQITVGAQLAAALRRVLKFGYDEENQLVTTTDAMGFVTRSAIDAPGNVVAVTDANGNTTRYDYDRNNRLVKETRPLLPGQANAYTVLHRYDANGNEIETTDENGGVTRFSFDKDNNRVMVSDANGIETVFTYDSRHNTTSIAVGVQAALDANGRPVISDGSQGQVTTFVYDEFNQVVSSVDGVGNALVGSDATVYQNLRTELGFAALVGGLSATDRTALLNRFTERFSYDRVGNLVRSVDHLGRITGLEYDALNRLQKRTEAQGTALERVTALRYDGNANLVRSTDPLGRVTTSTYDAANRLTATTNPLGVSTQIEYDNVGNIVASTEAAGSPAARRTEYVYDLNDRLKSERDPGGHPIAYEYDAVGNRLKVTDARGAATNYVYDALNRNIRVIDPLSFETKFEYDGVGNQVAITDARGGITRFVFDPGNRLIKTTDAEGRITELAYDPLDNVITQTTAAGTPVAEVTRFAYDAEGNLRSVIDAAGKTSKQGFDDVYNRSSVTDGNGNKTSYAFDALNRNITVTNALGGITRYTYDLADNRLTETDPLLRERSFGYDAEDRVISETDALGTRTLYAYDAVDNRISITRAAGTPIEAKTLFEYDIDDNLVKQTDALLGVTRYEYDANHNVTKQIDPNLHATTFEYDAKNQVTRIVDALGNATRLAYDGNGNRVQVIDARNNATTTYYNKNNEVALTVDARGFATSRSYDANGNIVAETQFMTALALPVNAATLPTPATSLRDQTISYEYDGLNRLVKATDAQGGVIRKTYDAVGNVLTETDPNNRTTTYEYDALDRRVKTTDAKGGVSSSTYDAVGNRLTDTDALNRVTNAKYDALNRLVESSNALGDKTTFSYDAVGNLLVQTDALLREIKSSYDLLDRLIEQTDERGIKTKFEYDAVGNLLKEIRAFGTVDEASTTLTYDELNRVITQADGLSQVTTFGYDAVGNQTTVKEPRGPVTTTEYDATNQVVKVTDAASKSVTNVIDGAGNIVSETDANNRTRVDYYDKNNRLVLTVDANGFAESYAYDAAGNLLANTRHKTKLTLPVDPNVQPAVTADAADKTTRYTYDELNRIATITDGEGFVTTISYDAVGNTVQSKQQVDKTDPSKDEVTRQYYDALDRLVATVSPEGHLSTVEYDKVGNETKRTDHDKKYTPPAGNTPPTPDADDPGRKVDAVYDKKGRLIEETDSNGVKTTHEYDERGNETKTTEAVGKPEERSKETKYDKANRVVESKDALGVITRYIYDSNDNVVERVDAVGLGDQRRTFYEYNALNQITKQTDALGIVNVYVYDAFGNKTSQTLAQGRSEQRTESFEYDGNNNLVKQINGEGEVTRFEYDGAGNQTKIIVAEGLPEQRTRSFEYDKDHRVTAEVDGVGVRTEYRYDGQGNRIEVIEAKGVVGQERKSTYTYDKDGNLKTVTDPKGNVTRFDYDASGNQTKITDANGTVTENTYDKRGRITTTITGVGGPHGGIKVVNEYDSHDNIVKTTQSYADGTGNVSVTSYEYDKLNRQTLVTDAEGFSTRFSYDPFGNQTKIETGLYLVASTNPGYSADKAARAKVVTLAFTYDALDRLLTTTTGENTVVAASYDAFGNRLTQTTRKVDGSDARTVNFKYDLAGRLKSRTTPAGGEDLFTYDKAGNQTEIKTLQSGSGASAVYSITGYSFDGNGRVRFETDPLGNRTEHVYDAVGNEIETRFALGKPEAVVIKSEFDLASHLVAEIDGENKRSDYVVDKVGNRIKETDALGRVTHLYYDALGRHVGTLDPERYYTAFERDALGNITASRIYLNRYAVPASDLTAPAPAAADPRRLVSTTYDLVGNPIEQTGANGIKQQFVYSSTRKLIKQTTFGTDDAGDISRTSDGAPRIVTFEYDAADRMVKFVNVDGVVETYKYDSANNKTEESITSNVALPDVTGTRSDPVRTTTFEYDLDNRLITQTFDPTGLNLIERVGYDFYGNVTKRTDANGNVSTIDYDLANRQTAVNDALTGVIRYGYDALGRRTSVTDARGNKTDLEYDKNGNLVREVSPQVSVFTIAGGVQSVRPEKRSTYDAAGNVVQVIDANGNKSTRWYDGNDNLVAELNSAGPLLNGAASGALREYTYNATDDLVDVTQYMTWLPATAHDPAVRPTAPSGEARKVTNEYDAFGRLIKTIYPAVEVTTLANTNTGAPTASTQTVALNERNTYDRFGNLAESFDRNGNRTVAYYDKRDRVVAAVDEAGFLTETDFDSQGNVVRQRQYGAALSTVSAGTRPTAPGTPAAIVNRTYDSASRLTEEVSAEVKTAGGLERIRSTFTYDKNGNQLSRTLAAGTTDAVTEYSFYDALDRRVGSVDAGRVLVEFGFDKNGNNTLVKRYFDTVSAAITLSSATFTQVKGDVTADPVRDQEKTSSYDALNRQTGQSDLMGAGTADDITVSTRFDAVGNVTGRVDANGFVSTSAFNAAGQIIQSTTPDGNTTYSEYDTGGLRIGAYTGDLGSVQAVQASNVAVSLSDQLLVSYTVGGTANQKSYVVYDTVARSAPEQYANKTGLSGAGNVSVGIPVTASLPPGTTVYFRVVTVDAAGSTTWTDERSVVVPVRLTALATKLNSSNNVTITVRFSGVVSGVTLLSGLKGGTLGTSTAFTLQADGSYQATLATGASDIQGFAYQIRWTFNGTTYTSSEVPFEAPGEHTAIGGVLTWPVPTPAQGTSAPNGQFVIVNGVRIDSATQANGRLAFDPALTTNGTYVYHVYYGDLVATEHTVNVGYSQDQSTSVISDTTTTGGTPPVTTSRTQVLRWQNDTRRINVSATLTVAERARVGAGGLHTAIKAAGSGDQFTLDDNVMGLAGGVYSTSFDNLAAGDYDILVYYNDATTGQQVIVEWRRITAPSAAALPADVSVTDNGAPFDFGGQSVTSVGVTDSSFPFNLSRTVTVGTAASFTGQSVMVTAFEREGSITRTGSNLSVNPGFYSGGLDPQSASLALTSTVTGSTAGGSKKSDGKSAGTYFIETVYNAVGAKIATNEDTGVWRRFGVDANGNAVQTRSFGTRADETAGAAAIVTFSTFDSRNLETATFGAAVAIDSNGDGTNEAGTARAVTRSTYNYAGRLATRLDSAPGAQALTYEYDGAGNLIRSTDALGKATTIVYNRRGRETKRTDPLGHSRETKYDTIGRMTEQIDGAGGSTKFDHDVFNRVIKITDGLNHASLIGYDQQDRLTQVTDANGNATTFTYDKRGDRIWVEDANHHFFGTAYDSMRRVTNTYSFQGGNPTSLTDAIDAVGNTANARNAFLVNEKTSYDIFGNKASETDAEKRTRVFDYGAFGRLLSQTDEGGRVTTFSLDRFGRSTGETSTPVTFFGVVLVPGKNITRTLDDAGRLTSIVDAVSGVSTAYTYDAGGNRRHETITAPDFAGTAGTARNVTYGYDGSGRMTSWSDAATGHNLAYTYDDAGNLKTVIGSASTSNVYAYDAADRLLSITKGGTVALAYTYDAAGNRKTYGDGTTTFTYTYDNAGRVTRATKGSGEYLAWEYDAVGNVKKYTEHKADNTAIYTQTYTYTENNRTLTSATEDKTDSDSDKHSSSSTTNSLDKDGRVLSETQTDFKNENKTTIFVHAYTLDGREVSVTSSGGTSGSTGSSSSTYDANDNLIRVDLGQSDSQESAEYKRFIYNNDAQILRRFHDDGENDTANTTTTQYLYALGNPVGESGNNTSNETVTVLDSGNYDLIENIGRDYPTPTYTEHEVQAGQTLQAIATQVYGNPSLWFVIADANGLTGDDKLVAGTKLKIPNSVALGRLTAEAHALYQQSDIVGSTLPNLKAPPPDDSKKCAAIGAIIGVILLAIVGVILSIVTIGLAAPAVAAAVGGAAGVVAGLLVSAAIGAAIAFTVSALSQVILVAAGLQKEFDWTQVLADTVVGFVSGGVAGLGQLLSAGVLVGRVAKIATVVASAVLEATGETLRQVIVNPDHRPDNPLSIVLAGVGGAFGAVASIATRAAKLQSAAKVAGAVQRAGFGDEALAIGSKFRGTIRKLQDGTKIVKIVEKDGTVIFKQVTRLSAAAKGAAKIDKTLDVINTVPRKKVADLFGKVVQKAAAGEDLFEATKTIAKITADIKVVKTLTTGQRAAAVLVDAFGSRIGGALVKVGSVVSTGVGKVGTVLGAVGSKVGAVASKAATAVGAVLGKAGTAIASAGGRVATAIKSFASTAAAAVGRLGKSIGTGLAKLGGVLAKPFRAVATSLVRTALGANAAGRASAVVRGLATAALLPAFVVSKIGSLVVRGVSKAATAIASAASAVGAVAKSAIVKFGTAVSGAAQKVGQVVQKVANGAATKAASAVRAIGQSKFGQAVAGFGRNLGRKVKDLVIDNLDPVALPFTIIGAGLSGGRVMTRDETQEGKVRARYFQTQNGLAGPTTVAYGTQGPAGGIGAAIKATLELYKPAYRPPTWENNAARTTTGVYSGFSIDRAVDLETVNALNLIRLGRVGSLDQRQRDDYAAQAIGRVRAPADQVPMVFLDPAPLQPSPVLGG